MENNQNATTNDFLIPDTIEETISQIKWMPIPNNQILASCWDSRLKVWQFAYNRILTLLNLQNFSHI